MMPTTLLAVEDSKPYKITLTLGTDDDRSICDVLVDNVFWGSLDTYAATSGQLTVNIPLARLGQHTLEIRNRPERNKSAVPSSATSFKLEFKQLETAYDGHAIDYTYDDLSRLLAADYFAAWDDVNPVRDYTFAYDVAGNRLSEVVNVDGAPFSSQTHTYDAANRISSAGFAYNDAGQMTADGTLSYSWDRAGRLLGAGDSSYAYNGLGQRVQQTVSGVVTDYLLDVQPGLAKVIAAMTGANTERFVHERGLLSQQDSVGDWTWMVKDGLGSVRGVIDDGFDAVASRHFAPYGVSYDEQGSFTVPFAFTGEMLDANGLQYHRARYYNPALGAFPSLDPVEGVLQQAMSLNRYAYVAGNVMNAVDPSGMIGEQPPNCTIQTTSFEKCCGPDVSAWFVEELNIHRNWVEQHFSDLEEEWLEINRQVARDPESLVAIGSAMLMDFLWDNFRPYARAIPYKWMNFRTLDCPSIDNECKRSVTLCNKCIDRSELGNIMFGWAGKIAGIPATALWVGGRVAQGLSGPAEQSTAGLGYVMASRTIASRHDLCGFLQSTSGNSAGSFFDLGLGWSAEWDWDNANRDQGGVDQCTPCSIELTDYAHTVPGLTGDPIGYSVFANRPEKEGPFWIDQFPRNEMYGLIDWAYISPELCPALSFLGLMEFEGREDWTSQMELYFSAHCNPDNYTEPIILPDGTVILIT